MGIILNETDEPKPCPFCGVEPEFGESDGLAPAGIFCNNEMCGIQPNIWATGDDETFENILHTWNCREDS